MFHLNSRLGDSTLIDEKHRRIVQEMANYSRPWGLQGLPLPEVPALNPADLVTFLSLTRTLKTPVRYAALSYPRRDHPYYHLQQDSVRYEFDRSKVSEEQLKLLIYEVLPAYSRAFDAYSLHLAPLQPYLDYVWEVGRRESYGPTTIRGRVVPCIAPVNYWSSQCCEDAFGRTTQEIADLLTQENVSISHTSDGIYVIFSDQFAADEHALDYELEFRPLFMHKST